MTDKEFMMNYQQANSTILNIGKIIDDLKEQNFQLQAEISRLNQCTGTPKNPHNHSAEIKADSAQIDQNNKWINQLDKLHKGISDLKALAQATDQKLVAYLEEMMNDRNISKDNDDINADKQRIKDLQNQIHNAENNPHIPPEQVDAMLKEVENCKNDIKLKQCSIDQLEKDNFSKQIEQAKLGGANSMQIDAMTAELNAKAEQVKQQIQDIQKEALQKVQAPEATTPKGIASDAGLNVTSGGTPVINSVADAQAYQDAVNGRTSSNLGTNNLRVNYDISDILCQNNEYTGWASCYATSMNNMWRVNDGAKGNKIADLADNTYGTLNGSGTPSSYTDDNGNIHPSARFTGGKGKYCCEKIPKLTHGQADALIKQELSKGKMVCVRVSNVSGEDSINGHTMNISGIDSDGNYLYNNCGRKTEKNRNGLKFEDQFYDNTVYYELNDGHCEVIIDTTK